MSKELNIEKIIKKYPDDRFITLDGFDSAIIGLWDGVVVYSISKIINILETMFLMNSDEAYEYYYFNIENSVPEEIDADSIPIFIEDDMLLSNIVKK